MNQFIINSKRLCSALDFARKAGSTNQVVPILEEFLVVVKDKTMYVTMTDLHTSITVSDGVEVFKSDAQDFEFILEGRAYRYLQMLEEQPITVKHDPATNLVFIAADEEHAKFGYDQKAGDYPKLPSNADITPLFKMPYSRLHEFTGLLEYASDDEMRPALTGIFFSGLKKDLHLVATDGHTMKIKTIPDLKSDRPFIMKARAARILTEVQPSKFTDIDNDGIDVSINANFTNIFMTGTHKGFNIEIISRTIDERYPDYETVVPKAKLIKSKFTWDRRKMISLLNKTKPFRNATTHQVDLRLAKDKCELFTQNYDFGSEFTSKMDGTLSGEDIQIGFNANFLLRALKQMDGDEFTLEMEAPNKATVIRDNTTVALTMPVMIDQMA